MIHVPVVSHLYCILLLLLLMRRLDKPGILPTFSCFGMTLIRRDLYWQGQLPTIHSIQLGMVVLCRLCFFLDLILWTARDGTFSQQEISYDV
jgi:hypothetical protein